MGERLNEKCLIRVSSILNPPISFQFRSKITHVLSKYASGEKKVLDHQVTPAAPGCPKSSSFYTGVNLVPVSMAGMATVGNGRQTTTTAAAAMAANRSKTMGPNLSAEDPTRVSKRGRSLFKSIRVGRERKVCSQDSSPVFLFSFPFSCAAFCWWAESF